MKSSPTSLSPAHIARLTEGLSVPDENIPFAQSDGIQPAQLKEAVSLFRDLIFPGYFTARPPVECLSQLSRILYEQICVAFAIEDCQCCAFTLMTRFMDFLPELRRLLGTDVRAMFEGDPAAKSLEEIILCYPSVMAIVHYRMAHALLQLGIPILPRIITELAHQLTGIDIHPAAQIGERFAIDHGTGVVIGSTCIIGKNVRLYQGVTLGARSFQTDDQGRLLDLPRHPILEDGVTVYSGASILGRITIGRNSTIGGNVWQTQSVPPNTMVMQGRTRSQNMFEDGGGI